MTDFDMGIDVLGAGEKEEWGKIGVSAAAEIANRLLTSKQEGDAAKAADSATRNRANAAIEADREATRANSTANSLMAQSIVAQNEASKYPDNQKLRDGADALALSATTAKTTAEAASAAQDRASDGITPEANVLRIAEANAALAKANANAEAAAAALNKNPADQKLKADVAWKMAIALAAASTANKAAQGPGATSQQRAMADAEYERMRMAAGLGPNNFLSKYKTPILIGAGVVGTVTVAGLLTRMFLKRRSVVK